MRFLTFSTVLLLGLLVVGCGSDTSTTNTPAAPPAAATPAEAASGPCADRTREFLRWYLQFEAHRPDSALFVGFARDPNPTVARTDTTAYLQVNRQRLNGYLRALLASGYFSTSYLQAKRTDILRRAEKLEAQRLADGEPEGFEADEIFGVMDLYEPEYLAQLRPYHGRRLPAGTFAYELPTPVPEGSTKEISGTFSWLLYLKNERGRCVVDSVALLLTEPTATGE